jgi:hypothetical protein
VAAPVDGWRRRQDEAFAVDAIASTPARAERFLDRVGIALRYNATASLPIASLQRAFAGDLSRRHPAAAKADSTRAIALTNHLLGTMTGIEVHVIASRVAVVHRRVMPALYALVRRGRALDDLEGLSLHARTALALLRQRKEVSAGDVRHRLGLPPDPRNDPAYAALGELMRIVLVDRGPFEIPKKGIAYLPREGYPYHLFHEVHGDLVAAAKKLSLDAAADAFLAAYLQAAVFARARKLATLFRLFLSSAEIDGSLGRLVDRGRVEMKKAGSVTYHVWSSA